MGFSIGALESILVWAETVFTINNFLMMYPWILNGTSLLCAYCLSNHKVTAGRYIGVVAATGWSTYGLLINELSFFFANIIFAWIYGSAIVKFNSKRDEYKATFADLESENLLLKKDNSKKSKELSDLKVELSILKKTKKTEVKMNKFITKIEKEIAVLKAG